MRTVALLAVLLPAAQPAAPLPSDFQQKAREVEASVAHVQARGHVFGQGIKTLPGTAFCIAQGGYLLTAAHVVEPEAGWDASRLKPTFKVFAYTERGVRDPLGLDAVVVFADKRTDLALLRAPGTTFEPLSLADSNSVRDDDFIGVLAFGEDRTRPYPGEGTVEAAFRPDVLGLMDLVLPNVGEGDSGSPLLNADGRVVAVLTKGWKRTEEGAETFGVPINLAAPLLSMAGLHHPSTLREWLEQTPDLSQTILDFENAVEELKTSWTYSSQLVWNEKRPESLEVTIRKRLEVGIWPDFIEVRVTPYLRAKAKGAPKKAAFETITLPFIELDIDDLPRTPEHDDPEGRLGAGQSPSQVEFREFKQLESRVASKLREYGRPTDTEYESWEVTKLDVHFRAHLWRGSEEVIRTEVHYFEP